MHCDRSERQPLFCGCVVGTLASDAEPHDPCLRAKLNEPGLLSSGNRGQRIAVGLVVVCTAAPRQSRRDCRRSDGWRIAKGGRGRERLLRGIGRKVVVGKPSANTLHLTVEHVDLVLLRR